MLDQTNYAKSACHEAHKSSPGLAQAPNIQQGDEEEARTQVFPCPPTTKNRCQGMRHCKLCKHFVDTSTCFGTPSSVLDCKTKLSDSFSISPSSLEVNPLSSSTADTMSIIWTKNNRETLVIQQGHENSMVKIWLILIFQLLEQMFPFCTVVNKWENKHPGLQMNSPCLADQTICIYDIWKLSIRTESFPSGYCWSPVQ